ncbi:hypothetical protein GCM10022280_09330 [Sphingomonas swuensis]|uniref:Uncharacterized protein n=1 Tax=Sphingomonas swuensis TaxID=977800 RepID=A0ABP7SLS5_9SPHN
MSALEPYSLYPLDADGRIAGPPHVVEAGDDTEAMRIATELCQSVECELWLLDRMIGRVRPLLPEGAIVEGTGMTILRSMLEQNAPALKDE